MSGTFSEPGRVVEGLRAVARLLYAAAPKRNQAVLWGWPDHEDSVVELEQALQRSSVRRVVVLMTDPATPAPVPSGPKTVRVRKDSTRGRLAFLSSRYVFFTHRCFMRRFPDSVVSVNVWHGMPIKRVGRLLPGDDVIESTHVLATSPFWAGVMDASMVATRGVLTTGLPRNDRLFLGRNGVWRALALDQRDDVDHLVAWLPTYRRSVRGRRTVDGRPTGSPFEFDVDIEDLDRFLAGHRALALVKAHPMAPFDGPRRLDNVLVVDDDWLRAESLSLYEVLGAADVLVSDVSSVTVDYLLVDRPVVHAMADLDEYGRTRGFSVEDVTTLLAGPVATTARELYRHLGAALAGEDPEAERRRRIRDRAHTHLDAGATDRLLAALDLLPAGAEPDVAGAGGAEPGGVHYGPETHDRGVR